MLEEAEDFSSLERFDYQPVKSVAVTVYPSNTRTNDTYKEPDFKFNGKNMLKVNSATHLGIKRSTSLAKTGEENIQQNIWKARRTAYSLFASGLHGHNGLDSLTSLHLIKIYIA